MRTTSLLGFLFLFSALALLGADRMRIPIPRVTDPPPQIDGEGLRFATLPGSITLDSQEKVAFAQREMKWDGPEDSSANVTFGWDNQCLYLFAVVKDNRHAQLNAGDRLFLGDHVMLVLDLTPGGSKEKNDLWKLGFSPGDFAQVPPSMHIWTPLGVTTEGLKCTAKKRDDGYQLEASIPWSTFSLPSPPAVGFAFGLDCIIGDSDTGFAQKTMLTLNGQLGQHHPQRLPLATLGTPDASVPPPPAEEIPLTQAPKTLKPGEALEFTIPPQQAQAYPTLVVNAILDTPKFAGGTYVLSMECNGIPLNLQQSVNRDETITFGTRSLASIGNQDTWFCFYNSAFDAQDYPDTFSAGEKIPPSRFQFDLSPLLKPDQENHLKLLYRPRRNLDYTMTLSAVLTGEKRPALLSSALGELQEYSPHALANPPAYSWSLAPNGAIAVTIRQRTFLVESSFSTRTPGWVTLGKTQEAWQKLQLKDPQTLEAVAREFRLERRVRPDRFRINLVDRVTNLTQEPLPLMLRHLTSLDGLQYARICGVKVSARGQGHGPIHRESEGQCPTTMLCFKEASLGLVSEDDYTRSQGYNLVNDTVGGIENCYLVVPPSQSLDLEYSIYPLEDDDEFIFINRIREAWNVNFTIPTGGMLGAFWHNLANSDVTVTRNVSSKVNPETDIIIMGGLYHGTNILEIDTTEMSKSIARFRRLFPRLGQLCYFHCFLSQSEYDKRELMEEAMLDSQGNQVNYDTRKFNEPLYEPVDGNRFAKRLELSLNRRFELGFDGIFWDELDRSCAKFDYNPRHWDGVTAEIDPKTHQITRRMSTVCLISQPWRCRMLDQLIPRIKHPNGLIGNGAPLTKTMTQYHFPRFIETGSVSNLRRGQLYSPLALGDHLSERSELDAYRHAVRCLDYGCVYYWYYYKVMATHPMLSQAMFPITPIELGKGYLIGQERIVVNKSGYYGWNDLSEFTARVFDASGHELLNFKVPRVLRDGRAFAELRLPMGYSAAIIRKQ